MQDTMYNRGNMTRIKIILWAALFTAMLVSCNSPNQESDDDLRPLKENEFYAQDTKTGNYYIVKANKIREGNKCVIWAEEGSGITQEKAKEIADEYDNKIRPKVVNTFSKKDFILQDETYNEDFDDMLDFAHWIVGGKDGKLTILLLDIKDDFKDDPDTHSPYVAGYFFGGDLYPKGKITGSKHYSNQRDMIYIDTYPGLAKKPTETYATFAHELQHLINFVTRAWICREDEYLITMDTWVDEGLSSQAEYLYLEKNPPDRYNTFINDEKETIAQGNNFFVWGNHREEPLAILDDYATVYLFFRWLYLQADTELQSHIFKDIETSNDYDYEAVTNVAQQVNSAWGNWETLLRTWLAANYYPKNSYGYIGDDDLQKITVKSIEEITKPIGGKISLYPGEGIYSNSTSGSSAASIFVRHAGLTEDQSTINTSPPYTGNVRLTFNANTNNTAPSETVVLTNVSPPISRTAARSIQTRKLTGPYVLDARDMLERHKR
jgi:hypothetical protein